MFDLDSVPAQDPGWTPVSITTLAIAVLAATPGVIAMVQNFRNTARPRLHATWQLHVRDSEWVELTVVNLGGATALDVLVKVLNDVHHVDRPDLSMRELGFDDSVQVGAGRGISRGGSIPIVDVEGRRPKVQVEVRYRTPPHNRQKRKIFEYRWKPDVRSIVNDAVLAQPPKRTQQ
ncbi:hypothetical protein [Leifsonia aquatica]|uniref:hypothetical protein n=1 Tax=Leifsonia aquatica TaxID=144185 RepID=UPI0037FAC799